MSFDYFVPLSDGWDRGRFTVDAAAGTYGGPHARVGDPTDCPPERLDRALPGHRQAPP